MQVLINNLPPESATNTKLRDSIPEHELIEMAKRRPDGKHGRWSRTDLLLGGISDRIDWVSYAVVAAAGGKPSKPKPLPRPGVSSDGGKKPLTEKAMELLRRLRNREGVD